MKGLIVLSILSCFALSWVVNEVEANQTRSTQQDQTNMSLDGISLYDLTKYVSKVTGKQFIFTSAYEESTPLNIELKQGYVDSLDDLRRNKVFHISDLNYASDTKFLFSLYGSLLESAGFTLLETDFCKEKKCEVYKIVKVKDQVFGKATRLRREVFDLHQFPVITDNNFVVRGKVVTLSKTIKLVPIVIMQQLLSFIHSKGGFIGYSDAKSQSYENVLVVITDFDFNIRKYLDIIESLIANVTAENKNSQRQVEIVNLKYADPSFVEGAIRRCYSTDVTIVDMRTRSIVFVEYAEKLEKLREFIRKLDIPVGPDQQAK